ncbi:hypothetical protein LPC08_23965 [Roseomonas sp. OT10]|uniref:hypothetical protein n=1 Tax=Roseomonas cutis TaxID=2897332 RepID=UPI001E466C66|nr:hypothetical protein [Roseomonas sp. OT10]UFN49014.1 hypothetical protein LPC08_23965 [Roseomonas sp. OT10]
MPTRSLSHAALAALIVLQAVMLAALYSRTPPYPPESVPLFALGPFLGAALAVAVAALTLGAATTRAGAVLTVLAAGLALVSFGPQKWLDPGIGLIWPAVLLGQLAAGAAMAQALLPRRGAAGS